MESHFENCKCCGNYGPHIVTLLDCKPHYARVDCGSCGNYIRFMGKPDSEATKYRRPKAHRDLVKKYSRGYCEFCGRLEGELPRGQTLEAQHIREFQDGGGSERENIQILCTSCHKLAHWVRTYHGSVESIGDVLKQWPL